MNPEEQQYLDLIKTIINNGSEEISRNGKVYSVFGNMMRFSLKNGQIPLLTTKKVAWKTCFKELFWFIKGSTSNHELKEQNVHIWDANASREFLDSRGLNNYKKKQFIPYYYLLFSNACIKTSIFKNAMGSCQLVGPLVRAEQMAQGRRIKAHFFGSGPWDSQICC